MMTTLKEISVEITNACNASCIMCNHRHMKRPVVHMDLGLLNKIIGEAIIMNPEPSIVSLCGIGDPLLHPKLEEVLKIASRAPRVTTGTNVQELDKEKRKWLMDARFTDIVLSIDATTSETHAKIRTGLEFELVKRNAIDFLDDLRGRERFWRTIYIQLVVTKMNQYEIKDFIDFWTEKIADLDGVLVFIKPLCPWPGIDDSTYPGPEIVPYEVSKVLWGPFKKPLTFRDNCNLFNNMVLIQSDGSYQPCCMATDDEFKIGNVKDNTIMELYNSPQMNRLRKLQVEKRFDEIPFCSKCT